MVNLATFLIGDKAKLINFGQTPLAYRQKLMQLGLTPGTEISILNKAPLGCPIEILVKNAAIAIRLSEAMMLQWERV